MRDARLRLFWHRAGPLTAIAALAMAGEASQGCGGGGSSGTGGTAATGGSTTTTMSTMSTGGMTTTSSTGGMTTTTGTGGMAPFTGTATVAANAALALDATPDPNGTNIYLTAVDPTNGPGVFKVPADGSATTPVAVLAGAPFAAPFGIAISTDGKTLYIADPGATDSTGTDQLGVIFSLPIGGGTATAVTGTAGTEVRSLEIAQSGGADTIFFTGHTAAGVPGVFKVAAAGGTVATVAMGAPFVDPSGITIASDGTMYVADTTAVQAPGGATASIIKIDTTGNATSFLSGLAVGYPAGIALSLDGNTMLLSSLDPSKYTDQLAQITVATAALGTPITMNINTFTEAAGMHRAKTADVFAWADSSAGAQGGQVFSVK
jgi:sugar lactone lactonase YvrE